MPEVKPPAETEVFFTGAKRSRKVGMGRPSLLPPEVFRLRYTYENVPAKYGFNNLRRSDPDRVGYITATLVDDILPRLVGGCETITLLQELACLGLHLLPPGFMESLIDVSIQFEEGAAAGYGDRNWEKGIPMSRYVDSLVRHVKSVIRCENDEPHERAVAWNCVCMYATYGRIERGCLPGELIDIPYTFIGSGEEIEEEAVGEEVDG